MFCSCSRHVSLRADPALPSPSGARRYLEQRRITLSILNLLLAKHGDTDSSDDDGDGDGE